MKRLLIAVALVVALAGCRPKAAPAQATADSEPATTVAPKRVDAAAPDTGGDPNLGSESPCRDDRNCAQYLRCEGGSCRVPPAVDGRIVPGMPTATFRQGDKELATIHLEIAAEEHERTRGLMYRRRMHPDFGMLFIFDDDAERSFWMKNTLIPLDMVHIDSRGRVVGIVDRAEPLTLSPRRTGVPARYVLELTAGRASELGIEPGVLMIVTGLPPEQSPMSE